MSNTTNNLRDEIARRRDICQGVSDRNEGDEYYRGKAVAYDELLALLDVLKKKAPEVDIEHELELYHQGYWPKTDNGDETLSYSKNAVRRLAEHFYFLNR